MNYKYMHNASDSQKNVLTKDVNRHKYVLTDSICMKCSSRKSQSVMR